MGSFGEVWLSRLLINPEVRKLQEDFHLFSLSSDRLVKVIEQLPDEIFEKSRDMMTELESQDTRIRDLLVDLQQTMKVANNLAASVNTTVQSADSLTTQIYAEPSDIDYEAVATKATEVTRNLNASLKAIEQLLASPNWDKPLPLFVEMLDQAEKESEDLITHAFIYGTALIIVFFLSMFTYRYATRRFL